MTFRETTQNNTQGVLQLCVDSWKGHPGSVTRGEEMKKYSVRKERWAEDGRSLIRAEGEDTRPYDFCRLLYYLILILEWSLYDG